MFKQLYDDNVLVVDEYGDKTPLQSLWQSLIDDDSSCEFTYGDEKFTVKWEDSFGGEGQGEVWWVVLKVSSNYGIEFFQVNGNYYSYDGVSIYDYTPTQVELRKVTVDKWCEV